jgi:ABC-2 type transport system ATP-binding protein
VCLESALEPFAQALAREAPVIEIHDVRKRFGHHPAVDGVSLSIPAGQIFGIIGPNGAGKSTLFRMICQIILPDTGHIEVFGARDELGIKRQIGYLPEEHRLYEHLKTLDYLHHFCDLMGVPRREGNQVLELVGLSHKAQDKISKLSKGMRQKVAFARTLLGDPPVLILDEPMYGLDPHTTSEMRGWIVQASKRKVVVLSSHNLHEAERVCETVAILHKGKVAAVGTPRMLIQKLKQEHVLEVGFRGDRGPLERAVASLPLSRPAVFAETSVDLFFPRKLEPYEILQRLLEVVQRAPEQISVTGISPREPTLEDVFLAVTGEKFASADEAGAAAGATASEEAPT